MKIIHGIVKVVADDIEIVYRRNHATLELPPEFERLLRIKVMAWGNKIKSVYKFVRDEKGNLIEKKFLYNVIPFTFGMSGKYAAISIADPRDQFSRKIGVQIVSGRLKHANQNKYEKLPNTVIEYSEEE